MTIAYIALGSNLNAPLLQLEQALMSIAQIPQTALIAASSFYANPPLDDLTQPDYINAVAKIKTQQAPHDLLNYLLDIETRQGRVRNGVRWQARSLDLDLLLFDQEIICTESLIVPHPGITMRAFVIYPLLEIDEGLVLPDGTALASLKVNVKNNLTVVSYGSLSLDA